MTLEAEASALVDALQLQPRASWTDLGRVLGVNASTVARRWERLSSSGLAWMAAYPHPADFLHIHWSVVGPHFIAVHEMLDPQADKVRGMTDDIAERISTLGGEPNGTPGALVSERTWNDYSIGRAESIEHLGALVVRPRPPRVQRRQAQHARRHHGDRRRRAARRSGPRPAPTRSHRTRSTPATRTSTRQPSRAPAPDVRALRTLRTLRTSNVPPEAERPTWCSPGGGNLPASRNTSRAMRRHTRSGGAANRSDTCAPRAADTTRRIRVSSSRQRGHDATCRRAPASSSPLA
ncbi:hypothetical protein STPH1_1673 [Streptomyces sp. OM5714]|nr:hypothetical protein STPH1_1673 [Streptomyces sp. OM5714]